MRVYGKVDLLTDEKDGMAIAKPCHYFTFNEFYRMPNVEAAILFVPEGSMLCLNLFSATLETFRRTRLYKQYEEKQAIVDPAEEETVGEALIADRSIDRRDEKAVIDYAQLKYGIDHVIPFKPLMYTAMTRVPVRTEK